MVSGGWGWDVFPNSLNNHQHSGSDTTRTTFQSGKDMDIVTLCGSSTTGSKISMNGLLHMTSSMWAHWHWKNWKSHAQSWAWGFSESVNEGDPKFKIVLKKWDPRCQLMEANKLNPIVLPINKTPTAPPKTITSPRLPWSLQCGTAWQGMEFFPFLDPIMVPLAKSWFIHL